MECVLGLYAVEGSSLPGPISFGTESRPELNQEHELLLPGLRCRVNCHGSIPVPTYTTVWVTREVTLHMNKLLLK